MMQAKDGDSVKVHYTGKLKDGSVFDSSEGREPLEFKVGAGQVIPDFENAVIGMNIGDSKTVDTPAENAYGAYSNEMIVDVPLDQFPPDIKPEIGLTLQMRQPDGHALNVVVSNVSDTVATLDANHPLAGKDLTFEIRLIEIA
jgi:peptidylprolyl isomerase